MFASAFVPQEREARRRRNSSKSSSPRRFDDIERPTVRIARASARTAMALRQVVHVLCGRFLARGLFALNTLEQPVPHRLTEQTLQGYECRA